MPNCRHMLN